MLRAVRGKAAVGSGASGDAAADLRRQLLTTWRVNDAILLRMLGALPRKGLSVRAGGSRARTIAEQFKHMHAARVAWLRYNARDLVRGVPRLEPGSPTKADLRGALRASGRRVADLLDRTLRPGGRVRMFGGSPVRWLGYLIAHESHHRGQIALGLKLVGMELPDRVAVRWLWGMWASTKRL